MLSKVDVYGCRIMIGAGWRELQQVAVKLCALRSRHSEWSKCSFLDALILPPGIVSGQIDVVPVHGSDVLQPGLVERSALCTSSSIAFTAGVFQNRAVTPVDSAGAVAAP